MKNNYKKSKYNIIIYANDDDGIIYNSYSGFIIKATNKNLQYLNEENFENIPENIRIIFIEKGYIVSSDFDEDRIIDELRNNYIEQPDSLFLYILPTEECNFRCEYCYERFNDIWMDKETQDSIISYVEKNIHKYKVVRVEWFGGEPLLCIDIIEYMSSKLIKICKENKVIYHSVMTTNAYLLNLENFMRLKKCRILSYQITIDGFKSTHDKQRFLKNGGETFDCIINNLKQIQKNIKTQSLDVTIRVNVSKALLPDLINFIEFLREILLFDMRFKLRLLPVGNYGGKKVEDFNHQLCDINELDEALDYCKRTDIILDEHKISMNIGGCVCYASRNDSWIIGADGKIYKCTVLLYDDRNHIGYVGVNGNFTIEQKKLSKWTARQGIHNSKCESCSYRPLCLESRCYKRTLLNQDSSCKNIENDIKNNIRLFS